MADDFGYLGVFLLAFFLLNNYSSVSAKEATDDVTAHITQLLQSEDGYQAAILDNLLPGQSLKSLLINGFVLSPWKFSDARLEKDNNNIPWKSELSPEFFEKTHVWKILQESISHITKSKELYPYSVTCNLQRRYDRITLEKTSPDDYHILLFLNKVIKKNDYGHLSLYKNGSSSIVMTAHPRTGRVVFWHGKLSHLYHPPSMNYFKAGYIITIKATESKQKYEAALKDLIKNTEEQELGKEHSSKHEFPMLPGNVRKDNLDEHVTRKFYDSKNRVLAVYDNLLTNEQLDVLYAYLSSVEDNLMFGDADTEVRENSDNVAWIKSFPVLSFLKSNMWDVVSQVAQHVSGNKTGWYPYDVSLNVIRTGDHTRIHEDCEKYEYEYTFLLYMNPDWKTNDYGETVYFNEVPDHPIQEVGEGNEQYEPLAAVKPKFGRIAIFRGIIPHSARPPSSNVPNARYTFAVKVGETKRIANAKALRETFEMPELSAEDQALLNDLEANVYATNSDVVPDSWVDNRLKEQLEMQEEFYKQMREDAAEFLLQRIEDIE